MEKTAIIYARVSTHRQAEEELPIQSQVEQCRNKAHSLGAEVVYEFVDEGISGRSDARPGFQDSIAYAETYTPDYFICWSTSRFSRNKLDAALYKLRLAKAEVPIVYVSLNIDRDSDAGWMTEGVLELFDEFSSRQVAADTMRSMIKNARDGYRNGGRAPFGFSAQPAVENPKRKRLVAETTESMLVQYIFEMRAYKGMGCRSITLQLRDDGHLNRGKEWSKSTVAGILRNEAVIGRTVFGKKDRSSGRIRPRDQWIVVDSHEPIISKGLWDKAQACLDRDAERCIGSPKSNHFFSGLLKCGECGAPMHSYSGKGRSRRYHYYICSAAKTEGAHKGKGIRTDIFDPWMADILTEKVFTTKALKGVVAELKLHASNWHKEQRSRRNRINQQKRGAEEKADKIYELFETHGEKTPHLGDLTTRLRKHNKLIKDCEQKIKDLDAELPPEIRVNESDVGEIAGFLKGVIKDVAEPIKVREFFSSFVESIEVGKEKARINYDPGRLISIGEHAMVPEASVWLPELGLQGTFLLVADLPDNLRLVA